MATCPRRFNLNHENGDSTTFFHNAQVICTLSAKFGVSGFDFGGLIGSTNTTGLACPSSGQTENSSTGTITVNNGAGSITPGVGAPYDFTRAPNGVIWNITSGGSIVFGSGGLYGYGNVFKVYLLKEPTDGIYGVTPGTVTITETTPASGTCPAGCVLFTGSMNNASTIGFVALTVKSVPESATLTIAASGGAVDLMNTGIYDNTTNGIILAGGLGRGGLSLPDSVSTPAAVINPWFYQAAGAPDHNYRAWSSSGSTLSFTTLAQNLIAGQRVVIGGLPTTVTLNGASGLVSATGLSSTTFQIPVTAAVGSATETGTAMMSDFNTVALFEMEDNGITGGVGGCQQATTANPTGFQNYSFWLNQYITQWQTANPLIDFQFVSALP